MGISSSAQNEGRLAASPTMDEREASFTSIVLSERSIIGLALLRIFVGYLWFQQLFWKLPPSFAGLYPYIVRETKYTFVPGYSYVLQ
ncbi:MAG TPA: hypothetical protein DCS90_17985, partial [Ktedonobacter sp.]|nr:hypothetical protein [Ktedonobacter sp.]